MAKIIVGIQRIDTQGGFDIATTADIQLIVKDHPVNIDRHLHLLGLLANANLVLSDDNGTFTVTIQEKDKEK